MIVTGISITVEAEFLPPYETLKLHFGAQKFFAKNAVIRYIVDRASGVAIWRSATVAGNRALTNGKEGADVRSNEYYVGSWNEAPDFLAAAVRELTPLTPTLRRDA